MATSIGKEEEKAPNIGAFNEKLAQLLRSASERDLVEILRSGDSLLARGAVNNNNNNNRQL